MLLDLMMPDMDGWDVYQQIKADPNTQNIPVIVITAKRRASTKYLACTSPRSMITFRNRSARKSWWIASKR